MVLFFLLHYEAITHTRPQQEAHMDLGILLDSCSWYDIDNFLQTCIKHSLQQTKSI